MGSRGDAQIKGKVHDVLGCREQQHIQHAHKLLLQHCRRQAGTYEGSVRREGLAAVRAAPPQLWHLIADAMRGEAADLKAGAAATHRLSVRWRGPAR